MSVVDRNDLDNLDNGINPLDYDVSGEALYSGRLNGKELSDLDTAISKFSKEGKSKISKYIGKDTKDMANFLSKNKSNFGDYR